MRKFNAVDAQAVLEIAQSAPIQNFHVAKNLEALFQRYVEFMQEQFAPKPRNEQVAEGVSKALEDVRADASAVELPEAAATGPAS